MRLLYYANIGRVKSDDGWDFPEWVAVSQGQLMRDIGVKDKHTLYKLRDELIAEGYIDFQPAKGREPTRYRLTYQADAPVQEEKPPKPMKKPTKGSFNTDEFWEAAVKRSLGE